MEADVVIRRRHVTSAAGGRRPALDLDVHSRAARRSPSHSFTETGHRRNRSAAVLPSPRQRFVLSKHRIVRDRADAGDYSRTGEFK